MSRDLLFVTAELAPYVRGGAGRLLAELRDRLVAAGHSVRVLLVTDRDPDGPLPVWVQLVQPGGGPDPFRAASAAAAEAVARTVAARVPDVIEIQDFDGLAFDTLLGREAAGTGDVPVWIRFHGPADLQMEAVGRQQPELAAVPVMEIESYRMADAVVVPSDGIGRLVADRYGVEPSRIVVGPPPVRDLSAVVWDPAASHLLCVGRLGEVKGSHDLFAAAIPVLRRHPQAVLEYVGDDGWSVTAGRSMREWLRASTPPDLTDRVVFTDHVDESGLRLRLAEAAALVAPSRFESFHLGVHEARRAGIPVVVPDLPAFTGLFAEETGGLVYDGTRAGLEAALESIVGDEELRRRLAAAPTPDLGDPIAPYAAAGPPIRHPRSQAGLATAAAARYDEATRRTGRWQRPATGLLRVMPDSVAALAVRILPQRMKDRFRDHASWPAEQERRAREARWRAVREQAAEGAFPPLDEPEVTVVIPCFNQGGFVADALLTVFEQTRPTFEVIVVDDGSTDEATIGVLDRLDLPRVRVIRQENRGLAAARNRGMAEAAGRYLVPLDADDELAPAFLERMIAALEPEPEAGYAHCWAELFGDIEAVWATRPWNRYQILVSNSVVGCVVLRSEAWRAAGGYDETMTSGNEDWELWVRLASHGWGAVEVREPLFRYRKHGISMSVDTEARHEEGAAAVVSRNRETYESLRDLKRAEYPQVTLLVTGDRSECASGLDDVQRLVVAGPAAEMIADAKGKYVVDWRGVRSCDPGYVERLAAALEAAPGAGEASPAGGGPNLVRRWSLVDPTAPQETVTVDVSAEGGGRLELGAFPDERFIVPSQIQGLPVQRQRPEVEGFIPKWAAP